VRKHAACWHGCDHASQRQKLEVTVLRAPSWVIAANTPLSRFFRARALRDAGTVGRCSQCTHIWYRDVCLCVFGCTAYEGFRARALRSKYKPEVEGTGWVAQNRTGMRRELRRRDERYNRLIPLGMVTPWLTDDGGRRRIGGSVGRVDRCRRSEAGRLHWGLLKGVFIRRNNEPYPIS
jgi:hypothetical protein